MTQILNLPLLPPGIQEAILFSPPVPNDQKTQPTSNLLCPRELDRVNCGASRPSRVNVTERLNAEASS